ncbi:MAG: Gfo/Idh/MocA family oxidoreductase [Eubacteriales bacterium]|nr:Gfo/Idh/MocA family oxidoreductase [Eubacteriales bacterium]
MKILVIGLGSMGKRRIRLIQNHFKDHLVIGVDMQKERRVDCEEKYKIATFSTIQISVEKIKPDCAFVCSSPLSHNKIINECLRYGLHIFTEINLVNDGYDENIRLAEKKGLTLFLSSTFFYRNEIKYVKEQVSRYTHKLLYTYHVGQYLPDWHPWESYKNFFLGDKRSNGCREILAIDLPWIIKTFGKVTEIKTAKSKITDLNIDYPDSFIITFVHENGHMGVFIADVMAREPLRELKVMGEDLFLTWGGKPDSLKQLDIQKKEWETIQLYDKIDKLEGYSASIAENAYLEEIEEFFAVMDEKKIAPYGFKDDYYVLNIIDRIERECL